MAAGKTGWNDCKGLARAILHDRAARRKVIGRMVLAALLEALQTLKPDHELNVLAAFSSMAGVLTAVPLAIFLSRPVEMKLSSRSDERLSEVTNS
jgi:hypothetical protein